MSTEEKEEADKILYIHLEEHFDKEGLSDVPKLEVRNWANDFRYLGTVFESGWENIHLNWTQEFQDQNNLKVTKDIVMKCVDVAVSHGYCVEIIE